MDKFILYCSRAFNFSFIDKLSEWQHNGMEMCMLLTMTSAHDRRIDLARRSWFLRIYYSALMNFLKSSVQLILYSHPCQASLKRTIDFDIYVAIISHLISLSCEYWLPRRHPPITNLHILYTVIPFRFIRACYESSASARNTKYGNVKWNFEMQIFP